MPNSSAKPDVFDFVVIGGGSAGYTAAAEAGKLGLRTALIEGASELGGLCILRGCMPSKALIASANRLQAVAHAGELAIKTGGPKFQPRAAIARKRRLVGTFAASRRHEIDRGAFELIRGQARFLDPQTISVRFPSAGEERQLSARCALIATGSYIPKPEFPGLVEVGYMTSDDILESQSPPASVIVLGDGPVGLEAALYYAAIGTRVTLVSKHPRILPAADLDVAEALTHAMEKLGVVFVYHAEVESVQKVGRTKAVTVAIKGRRRTLRAQEIVFAVGRKPRVSGLGLEEIGVKLDDEGRVATSHQQRTNLPHLFAAGDVAGPYEILHLAVQQGVIAARNAARHLKKLRGATEAMDYRLKLSGIFTSPEVAMLGLSEHEAREKGIPIRTASVPFGECGRAQVEGAVEGIAKLICDRKTGKLLGAALVGAHAVELIHEMVAVLHFSGTAQTILDLPHYHPTLSEIWTFVAEKLVAAKN